MAIPQYTTEQIEYIRSIALGRTRDEITDLFNQKYKQKRTMRAIGSLMSREKIRNKMQGHATRLKEGEEAWNKGMKGLDLGGQAGWFKEGHTLKCEPIHSESVINDFVKIKIDQPNVWVLKHHYIWEQKNGTIPDNHVVLFKDGNKLNVTLDNLFMVEREVMTSVAKRKKRSTFPDLNETIHHLARLELAIKQKDTRKRGANEHGQKN